MKHLILLQSSFFAHVREGRHDLMGISLSEFKETTTAMCYAPDVIWHDVHFSLSYVQEELQLLLQTVATEISKFIHHAISFLGRMIEHVRLMITHPPLPTKKDNSATAGKSGDFFYRMAKNIPFRHVHRHERTHFQTQLIISMKVERATPVR